MTAAESGGTPQTERSALLPDAIACMTTRQSYKTIGPPANALERAFLNKIQKLRRDTLNKLRTVIPRHAGLIAIVDVVYDEDPDRYYLTVFPKLEGALHHTHQALGEPEEITFHRLATKLSDCVPIVELFGEIISLIKFQKRRWFTNQRRFSYPTPAENMIQRWSDKPLSPPMGHLRRYTLWINDLALRMSNPAVWRDREVFFRGPVPEHLRRVVLSPRSDTDSMSTVDPSPRSNTNSMSAIEPSDDEEEEFVADEHATVTTTVPQVVAPPADEDKEDDSATEKATTMDVVIVS